MTAITKTAFFALAAVLLSALPSAAMSGEKDVDAVTAASHDAETGASRMLDPIKISENFSVAYAMNDDGSLFIQARDLTDAYVRDELASDSLFKGKEIVVGGAVEKMSKPDAAKPWITLVGDGESGKKVRCALKPGQPAGRSVKPGDILRIRGTCDGMKLSVSLIDAEIVGP